MGQVTFNAKVCRPAGGEPWLFLRLPQAASDKLPSRSMVSVEGTFEGVPFQATLDPDGEGGHWLKLSDALRESTGAQPGQSVGLTIEPMAEEPEPILPADFRSALDRAPEKARQTWAATTAVARRDWIQWMTSGKRDETRMKRIASACDMLNKGKKRVCCFDRSGQYSKSMSCPIPAED